METSTVVFDNKYQKQDFKADNNDNAVGTPCLRWSTFTLQRKLQDLTEIDLLLGPRNYTWASGY